MAKVTLKELKSWREWLALGVIQVEREQRKYTSNLFLSYLQSTHAAITPYALYVDDILVGMVMLIHAQDPTQWIIERLVIDKQYQRKGYGYDVADQLIDMVYEFENSEMVVARYNPENEAARQLFAKLKFEEQEELSRNRNIAVLKFEFEEEEIDEDEHEDPDDVDEIGNELDDEEDWDEDDEDDEIDPDEDWDDEIDEESGDADTMNDD